MKYKIGVYGGSFDPLHIGHINVIINAASQCKKLYVILSYSRERDSIPMEYRYRWIRNSFLHMDNIEIILLEDNATSKAEYDTKDYWERGRDFVLNKIGSNVDVVFCGSDYKGTNRYEDLYNCEVVYFDRLNIPVSSTAIRNNPFEYWDYIPNICKSYYTKKVLIVGGESTGKSVLTQNLAIAYNTNFVSEVGRETCEYAGGEEYMIVEDLYENLLRQKTDVMNAVKKSNRVLFVDTDALTTAFYADFLLKSNDEYTKCRKLAESINAINGWDLILFLEPTVEFVQDGTRSEEIALDRKKYSNQIKQLFDKYNMKYYCIGGDYIDRFIKAKELIKEYLGIIMEQQYEN